MKKKIKDLTLEEVKNICFNKHKHKCYGCPLYAMKPTYFGCMKDNYTFYNKEVEVNE